MTREQWLMDALASIRELAKEKELTVPENIRVSCGLPSKRALAARNRTIGQCWSDECTGDKHFEIYISPTLDDASRVLDVLIHEVCHAIAGLAAGHGRGFKRVAVAMGLEGKMTATKAGGELSKVLARWTEELGPYPHSALTALDNGIKKDTTRMIKLECSECGYVIRTTRKWIETGIPSCCCGGEFELT